MYFFINTEHNYISVVAVVGGVIVVVVGGVSGVVVVGVVAVSVVAVGVIGVAVVILLLLLVCVVAITVTVVASCIPYHQMNKIVSVPYSTILNFATRNYLLLLVHTSFYFFS